MSDDENYGTETQRKELIRVRATFLSREGNKGASRSLPIKRNASLFELVPKALEMFAIGTDGLHLPQGAFVEIFYHNQLLGGWEDGQMWALKRSMSAVGIRDGLGPRMKAFNSLGQLLMLQDEHKASRWEVTGGAPLRKDGDTLRSWQDHGLVRLPTHASAAKGVETAHAVLSPRRPRRKSVKFASVQQQVVTATTVTITSRSQRFYPENERSSEEEPHSEEPGSAEDSQPFLTAVIKQRSRQQTSVLISNPSKRTSDHDDEEEEEEEETTEESSVPPTPSVTPAPKRSLRKRTRNVKLVLGGDRSDDQLTATLRAMPEPKQEASQPVETTAVAAGPEPPQPEVTYKIRLTFSGSEKFMHAQRKLSLSPETDVMEVIVAALEFCRFEALPIRPEGSFIEVVHGSTLIGGMEASGRVWAVPGPIRQLGLPTDSIAVFSAHVYSRRGVRLKATFYDQGWHENSSAGVCLSAIAEGQERPAKKRDRKSSTSPKPSTEPPPLPPKPESPAVTLREHEDEPASVEEAAAAAAAPPVATIEESKRKRHRSPPKTEILLPTSTTEFGPSPADKAEAFSAADPLPIAKHELVRTAVSDDTPDRSLLEVLRESYSHLSDKYLELMERHQQLLHDHSALATWRCVAEQCCVMCDRPIDSPANAAVYVGCGHMVIHRRCIPKSQKSQPQRCEICDEPVVRIVPLCA